MRTTVKAQTCTERENSFRSYQQTTKEEHKVRMDADQGLLYLQVWGLFSQKEPFLALQCLI